MPLDNSISNILGTKIPYWLWQQFQTRSKKSASTERDTEVIKFMANKTAWVRMVSSIDISGEDLKYFQKINPAIIKGDDLAKQYVLFGGTSKYLGDNTYALRSGFSGMDSNAPYGSAYGMMGKVGENDEIANYGYRPMPGIMNVSIETQGKLGSVRAATINFKCWTKDQLDIMDALYFKLGFTMFLEWGQTYYFPSPSYAPDNTNAPDPNKVVSTELNSIDPFDERYRGNKELIYRTIAKNNRETEGNYDAMLGMVTNFNFSFNQEGGYDCMVKLISLGVLGDSIKVNNSNKLVDLLSEQIRQYEDILKIVEASKPKEEVAGEGENAPPSPSLLQGFLSSGKGEDGTANLKNFAGSVSKSPENVVISTKSYDSVLYVKKLNRFLPLNLNKFSTSVQIDFRSVKARLGKFFFGPTFKLSDQDKWDTDSPNYVYEIGYTAGVDQTINSKDKAKKERFQVKILRPIAVNTGTEKSVENQDFDTYIEQLVKSSGFALPEDDPGFTYAGYSEKGIRVIPSGSTPNPNVKSLNKLDGQLFFNEIAKSIEKNLFASDSETFEISKIESLGGIEKSDPTINRYYFTVKTEIPVTLDSSVQVIGVVPQTAASQNLNFSNNLVRGARVAEINQNLNARDFGNVKELEFKTVKVTYKIPVEFSFQETDFISSFSTDEAIENQQPPVPPQKPEEKTEETPDAAQTENPFSYLSNLELCLRSIQVHSLNEALKKEGDIQSGTVDITTVVPIDLNATLGESSKTFAEQIFSNGIFTPYFKELVNGQIGDELTNNATQNLKVYAKYGFATKLMGNQAPVEKFKAVDYGALLKTYVLPYQINQVIESGTQLNFPVYIQFGTFLMLLNHSCTMYDVQEETSAAQANNAGLGGIQGALANAAAAGSVLATAGGKQTPLIYIDYNPNHNFCLTSPLQLSTDPFTAMIPFNGNLSQYAKLFDKDILMSQYRIKPVTGSSQPSFLLRPKYIDNELSKDRISGGLPTFVDEGSVNRGRIMNILINIDYLNETVKQYAKKDLENKVYLKPLLEQLISDINKSIGNFNIFRLAYNDIGNVFHIVDDQIIPTAEDEGQIYAIKQKGDDPTDLPIFGRFGIATKNLEIRTDVSSKLSNMIAVSANSQNAQAQNSTDGSTFGFINYNYKDRYIPQKGELSTGNGGVNLNGEIEAATQFNNAMVNFYSKAILDQNSSAAATNYYIGKLTKDKSQDSATRAAAMIPVSLNFTTDGISGLFMGQAFTVDKSFLPYTYGVKNMLNNESSDNKVGFVITGVSHTIDSNVWSTSVKTQMIFLKKKEDYAQTSEEKYVEVSPPSKAKEDVPISAATPIPISQNVDKNLGAIKKALISLGVTNKQIIIAALANAMKESGGTVTEEKVDYSRTKPARIREIFGSRMAGLTDQQIINLTKNKYEFVERIYGVNSGQIGKSLGNNQPGDGNKYIGRGFIQLTGKANYARYSNKWFKDDRLVKDPTKLNTVEAAAGVAAAFIQDLLPNKAKVMGLSDKINSNTISQEEANILVTSIIGGKVLNRKNLSGYFVELVRKVDGYSKTLEQKYDKL